MNKYSNEKPKVGSIFYDRESDSPREFIITEIVSNVKDYTRVYYKNYNKPGGDNVCKLYQFHSLFKLKKEQEFENFNNDLKDLLS